MPSSRTASTIDLVEPKRVFTVDCLDDAVVVQRKLVDQTLAIDGGVVDHEAREHVRRRCGTALRPRNRRRRSLRGLWMKRLRRIGLHCDRPGGGKRETECGCAPPRLVDEPSSALDPIATSKIEELVFSLRGEYAVLVVERSMQPAACVSDYTAFMHLGLVVPASGSLPRVRSAFERLRRRFRFDLPQRIQPPVEHDCHL